MLAYAKSIYRSFFRDGYERSIKARKNVLISLLAKGASISIGFVLVPMTINYVDPLQYGIWVTISSVIGWMYFFDIGMGLGLRNKLAHLLALKEVHSAKKYISSTYAIFSIIAVAIFIVFFVVSYFIDWNRLLNIPESFGDDIKLIISIVLVCFSIQFVVQILNTLLNATHQPSKSALIALFGQMMTLVIIFFLMKNTPGNLPILVTVLAGVPVMILILASLYLFHTSLKDLTPKLKHVDFRLAKNLLSTGGIFFVIQIGSLVLLQTDNIIITHILGPAAVTTFNVTYKLFSVTTMVFIIVMTPYWSAFTDAYAKKDFSWIKMSIGKLRQIWLGLSFSSIVFLFFSPFIFKIWIGDSVPIPMSLSIAMTLYVITLAWSTLHVYFLNGVGKVRLQLILVIASSLINIPLSIIFGKKFGIEGIITVSTVLFTIMGIFFFIQCEKIINNTATKVWNK